MRIERIEIDGFGRFHDVQWALDGGLTIFVGANEAGKTTLLNAVRGLLFGFDATRDGRTWYPAMAGGRRGGRLTLRTSSDDRWTVERHGERGGGGALAVRAPNGNQGGQETLDRLLHGADRDLFNNIFAFGLGELQTFASLSADGVRGRIYGAGAGLGGTSAVDIERRLRQQQEAVFLPRGRERPLNALLARTEALRVQIADLAQQPEEYEAAHLERGDLRAHAIELRGEARGWRERAIRLGHLRTAAPLAADLSRVEEELAVGDATLDALPADVVAILDRRQGELAEAGAVLASIDEQIDASTAGGAGLEIDDGLLSAADEIIGLRDERVARRAAAERRRDLEAAEARHGSAVDEQRARVGGWPEERLVGLEDSIASVEATREHEATLSEARAARQAADQRRRAAEDELSARERESSVAADDAGLDERADELREVEALGMRQASAEARAARGPGPGSRILAVAIAAAIAMAGLTLGVAASQPLIGVALGLLVGGVAISILIRPTAGDDEIAALRAERVQLLGRVGLAAEAEDAAVRELRDQIAARRARRDIDRERAAVLEARRAEIARLEREGEQVDALLVSSDEAWRDWLRGRGIPTDLSPEAARQLLGAAGAARRAAAERDQQRAMIAAARAEDDAYAARIDALLARLNHVPATDDVHRDAMLARLVDDLERSRDARRRAQELDATLARLAERRVPAAEVTAGRQEAVAAHIRAFGCDDPDQLRRRDAEAASRRTRHARARELRAGLAGIGGSIEAVAALVEEARTGGSAAVEATHVEAQAELERVEAAERDANNRIGALDARIRQLEAAEELGMRRQELAALEGQAAAIGREWAVRAIALRLLEETRSRYERERQPDVVRAATAHFERITGGRYSRIVAPPGDASVRVETEGGEGRVTDELSRGTAEQLYLALRFGLIEEFARHAEPLPVVMDDILVNFDAERAARAASAVRDLATRHQVIYFTCHAWTAELLDPDGTRTVALA